MPSRNRDESQSKHKSNLIKRIHKMKTRSMRFKSIKRVEFKPLDSINALRLKLARDQLKAENFYSTEALKEEERQARLLWRQQLEQHKLQLASANNPGVLTDLYTRVKRFFGY